MIEHSEQFVEMSNADRIKIKPDIDFSKIPPLEHHRTAVTFNCLILKITKVLNNFGNHMEEVLERAEHTLDVADRKLSLMEMKLANVNVDDSHSENTRNSSQDGAATVVPTVDIFSEDSPAASSSEPVVAVTAVVEELNIAAVSTSTILNKNHPNYIKYFKMMKMGVPEAAVIQKMKSEGIDSSILERGDEPSQDDAQTAPETAPGYESSGESISSFSESD